MKTLVTFYCVSEAALGLSGSVGHKNPLLVTASHTWASLGVEGANSRLVS